MRQFPFSFLEQPDVAAAGFPDQSLATWTSTEADAWLAYGASFANTTSFGYATTTTRIGGSFLNSRQYYGAALAGNGKIYGSPADGGTVKQWIVIDTNTGQDTVTLNPTTVNYRNFGARWDKITNTVYSFGDGGTKIDCTTDTASNVTGPSSWNGGAVQSFDGNLLYTAPLFSNNAIYEYNISTNTSTNKGSTGGDRYPIGTLSRTGKMFWPSGGGTQFTSYDPATSTLTDFGSLSGDYVGPMVQHYDGYIYAFPRFFNSSVLRLDPATNTITTIHTLSLSPQIISMDCCIGLDGRIYVTRENGATYWYDPSSNTSGILTMDSGDTSYAGITIGANGDLYMVPFNGDYVHKLALTTGTGTDATNIVSQYNFGGRMCWQ
jgi:hypothetical protein|tara:strand:+ start:348 stop:1481 length:1134 start_codon:yes stop_codon:yes gene_type:complete